MIAINYRGEKVSFAGVPPFRAQLVEGMETLFEVIDVFGDRGICFEHHPDAEWMDEHLARAIADALNNEAAVHA